MTCATPVAMWNLWPLGCSTFRGEGLHGDSRDVFRVADRERARLATTTKER